MGQLTLARFRGDTTFALVTRLVCTFLGGVLGMLLWYVSVFSIQSQSSHHVLLFRYISAGRGRGNAYGFAATLGVCFPFFYYGRLYWPGPPMTNIIFFVTTALVRVPFQLLLSCQPDASVGTRILVAEHAFSSNLSFLRIRPRMGSFSQFQRDSFTHSQ